MIEVADIFHQHAGDYINQFGQSLLPSHLRALQDIMACRTEILGGHVFCCDHCGEYTYAFHSCKNRSCPKCHTKQTQQWLEKRQLELLPVPYFHITLTIPEQLRALFRSNQKVCYSLLMQSASQAIQELALDPKYCGGKVAILAVLHTWTQQMVFHPHVHCLVSAGGLSNDGQNWLASSEQYLMPVKALSKLFRGKCLAALRDAFPERVFITPNHWVVHCKAWGKGETAVLDYLARYVFRSAMTCVVFSVWMSIGSAFVIKTERPGDGEYVRCHHKSSSDGFYSMFYPEGFIRCATPVYGIPQNKNRSNKFNCD